MLIRSIGASAKGGATNGGANDVTGFLGSPEADIAKLACMWALDLQQ
jgi:hypothetical protein